MKEEQAVYIEKKILEDGFQSKNKILQKYVNDINTTIEVVKQRPHDCISNWENFIL